MWSPPSAKSSSSLTFSSLFSVVFCYFHSSSILCLLSLFETTFLGMTYMVFCPCFDWLRCCNSNSGDLLFKPIGAGLPVLNCKCEGKPMFLLFICDEGRGCGMFLLLLWCWWWEGSSKAPWVDLIPSKLVVAFAADVTLKFWFDEYIIFSPMLPLEELVWGERDLEAKYC